MFQFITMSIINEGSSESLVIAEGKNDFQINSSEEKPKIEDDIFELSNDEVSLSFKIQEEQKMRAVRQLARQSQEDTLILNVVEPVPQQNKRKRKEIFERGKRPEKSILSKIQASKSQDKVLNIFDSIFNTKARDSGPLCGGQVNCAELKAPSRPFLEAISIRSRTPSSQKRQRVKIFGKKREVQTFTGVLPPDILQESMKSIDKSEIATQNPKQNEQAKRAAIQQVQSKLITAESPIKTKNNEESINFFNMSKRISEIEFEEQDISRDTIQINNILESEIFQDEPKQVKIEKQVKHVQRIQRRTHSLQEEKVAQMIVERKNESPDFSKKTTHKIHITQPLIPQTQRNASISIRSDQKEVSPVRKFQNISVAGQQIQESRYLINQMSCLSSAPEVLNHNYGHNGFAPENSTVNIRNHNFGDVSSLKYIDIGVKRGLNASNLIQSQVIQVRERVLIDSLYEQENRLPIFLRKIRRQISIYPNFYLLIKNPHTTQSIEKQFNQLIQLFREGIEFLSKLCQKMLQVKSRMQLQMQQLMGNLSLEFFLESGWQKTCNFEDYSLITPVQPIQLRGWSYQKAKTALANYESILNYYSTKGIRIDATSEKGQKKYFQIRQKFWDICGNLKLISEDIFLEVRNCMFPKHYYQFLQYMKAGSLNEINDQKLQKVRHLHNIFRYHRQKNDILLNSDIGLQIKKKIQLQLRYLAPF